MDTIALDPRLRHATGFLGRNALMLIDGKMVGAASGKTFPVYNPASGTLIANVPEADRGKMRSRRRRRAPCLRQRTLERRLPVPARQIAGTPGRPDRTRSGGTGGT